MSHAVVAELAPTGVLRAGINTQNFLLVSGSDDAGQPFGVAPSMARAIADKLGVPVRLIPYANAKTLGDAVDDWDIGLIGAEPARAERIAFTEAYCEIEASYLVRSDAGLNSIADVDRAGVRIAASAGSAYDLWLTRNIKHAEIVRAPAIPESYEAFVSQRLEALAGLKTWLMEKHEVSAGTRILDGKFTAVQQAVGTPRANKAGADFLNTFVRDAKTSGLVARFIEQFGIRGLSVAPIVAPLARRIQDCKQKETSMTAKQLVVDCHLHSHWPQRYEYLHPTGSRIEVSNIAASAENVVPALTAGGTTHCVLIQPGAYKFDNRAMMDVIAQSKGSIKAMVTLPMDASDEEFITLRQQGAVGVRLSLITFDPKMFESDQMASFLQRCKKHDYYVEVFAAAATWPVIIPILLKSGVKIIAEHIGWPQIKEGIKEPGFKALLNLGRTTDTIIKIQGGFRISWIKPPYDDLTTHVHALIDAFSADRCVWGSDWPFLTPDHGPAKRPDKAGPVTYEGEKSSILHWVKDETVRNKILWENPARFFGFDAEHTMVGLDMKL